MLSKQVSLCTTSSTVYTTLFATTTLVEVDESCGGNNIFSVVYNLLVRPLEVLEMECICVIGKDPRTLYVSDDAIIYYHAIMLANTITPN